MSAIQALMEREMGRLVLELVAEQDAGPLLLRAAEQRALGIVQDIQTVLDDPLRSDFDCVEEIIDILARAGITTTRHDYG